MKYLSAALLIICLSISVLAQDSKFELGVQGGPSITSIRYLNGERKAFKSAAAFSGGFFFQYNLNKTFSLRIDPSYEQKGYKIKNDFTDSQGNVTGEGKVRGNFDYITLPLLLRASVGNKVKYFVNAGPYMGLLLYQNNIVQKPLFEGAKRTFSNTNAYKTTDIGITAGIGLTIPIKDKFALSLEIRNNLGLMNIGKSSTENDKTNSTNLLIGFAYKFGRK
jgi:hypothetical protein